VGGAGHRWDFDDGAKRNWSTFSAPGTYAGQQWEMGYPLDGYGPMPPHSGSYLWGTDLDGDYQRGAWSFLVSPDMDFSEDVTYNLTFWAWWDVHWEDDFAYVLASDDGGATWDEDNAMVFMGSSLSHDYWSRFDFDLSAYQGSDRVRLAFVFYSPLKTLDVRTDASFEFSFEVPMTTAAGVHHVTVVYEGSLIFQAVEEVGPVAVRQLAEFLFPPMSRDKVGYRNKEVAINATLVDSTGAVVDRNLSGEPEVFKVQVYWDPTWTLEDGKGEAAGPPVTVGEGGEVKARYSVPWDHTLGPAHVTFEFNGSEFYAPVEQKDVYYVKAETYFLVPPTQDRIFFRGQRVNVEADLRIVVDQSIDRTEPGDPLTGEFVKVYWNGDFIGNRRTSFEGEFSVDYLVPVTHELGPVKITFMYEGQSLFDPVTGSFNYSVVSETTMTFIDRVIYKGSWIWMNGSIWDDMGQGLAGTQIDLRWRGGDQVLTTDARGYFGHQVHVEFADKVGNLSVTASFGGNSLYLKSSVSATYTYKIGTILQRHDNVRTTTRGEQVQLTARLYEDWGGSRGVEVQREVVTLLFDDIVVSYKRTAFDGSVTFTVPVDADKFPFGEVNVTFRFAGTEAYDPAQNITSLVIRALSYLSFAEVRVNGEHFDPLTETVMLHDEVYVLVLLQDDGFRPIPFETLVASYKDGDPRSTKRLIQSSQTDPQGYFEFTWTFYDRYNGRMFLIVEYGGHSEATSFDESTMIIEPDEHIYNFTYSAPGIDPHKYEVDTDGDRRVAPGSEMVLLVVLPDPGDWDLDQVTFSLVDPPTGMTITTDGVIKWTPGEDDVGDHTIEVKVDDGTRSEVAKVRITVGEEGDSMDETTGFVLWLLAGAIVAIIVVVLLVARSRRND
jgi:hypothetical protein